MMTNDQGDTAKLSQYIAEAKTLGIETLGPDVNASGLHFAPAAAEAGRRVIRFGLAAIKGVGEAAVEALLAARSQGGTFTNLEDLCGRVDTPAHQQPPIPIQAETTLGRLPPAVAAKR
jgi:DNA polymerase-3 subunit alpha